MKKTPYRPYIYYINPLDEITAQSVLSHLGREFAEKKMCSDGEYRELIEIPFEKVMYLYSSKDYSLGKNFLVFRSPKYDKDNIRIVNNEKFDQDKTHIFLGELRNIAMVVNKENERKLTLLLKKAKNKKQKAEIEEEYEASILLKHLPKMLRIVAEQGEYGMEVYSFETKKSIPATQLTGLARIIYDKLKNKGFRPHLTKMSSQTNKQGIYITWPLK